MIYYYILIMGIGSFFSAISSVMNSFLMKVFVLLDEPTSNLDAMAIDWYNQLVEEFKNDRVIIVCSNDQKAEFSFCSEQLNVEDFKQS